MDNWKKYIGEYAEKAAKENGVKQNAVAIRKNIVHTERHLINSAITTLGYRVRKAVMGNRTQLWKPDFEGGSRGRWHEMELGLIIRLLHSEIERRVWVNLTVVQNSHGKTGEIRRSARGERLQLRNSVVSDEVKLMASQNLFNPVREAMENTIYTNEQYGYLRRSNRELTLEDTAAELARKLHQDPKTGVIAGNEDFVSNSCHDHLISRTAPMHPYYRQRLGTEYARESDPGVWRYYTSFPMHIIMERQYKPGADFSGCPIYLGPSGCFKTLFLPMFFKSLGIASYITDSFTWKKDDADRIRACRDHALVIFDDVQDFRGVNLGELKNFVSRNEDRFVDKYEQNENRTRRTSAIICTTNQQHVLPPELVRDRRWFIFRPFPNEKFGQENGFDDARILEAAQRHIDSIHQDVFVEMRALVIAGIRPGIPAEVRNLFFEEVREATGENRRERIILDILELHRNEGRMLLPMEMAVKELQLQGFRQSTRELKQQLRKVYFDVVGKVKGYARKRICEDGTASRCGRLLYCFDLSLLPTPSESEQSEKTQWEAGDNE